MSRDKKLLAEYLLHIVEAVSRIESYICLMNFDAFKESSITQDAVIRNIEVVGEACRNIVKHYPDFAETHPALPLKSAYDTRNAVAHGYFDVDLNIVWDTVQTDLPAFRDSVIAVAASSNIELDERDGSHEASL
jgi:uncharacterized protein with HEPN domain